MNEPIPLCPRCGGPQAKVGPPINDIYCEDQSCNMKTIRLSMLERRDRKEKSEYKRLKKKFEPNTTF